MTTTHTVANSYAERLIIAKDKRKASVEILHRMSKLRYKGHSEPLPRAGKEKIIALIRTQVLQGANRGAIKATYLTAIAYMLEQVRDD